MSFNTRDQGQATPLTRRLASRQAIEPPQTRGLTGVSGQETPVQPDRQRTSFIPDCPLMWHEFRVHGADLSAVEFLDTKRVSSILLQIRI